MRQMYAQVKADMASMRFYMACPMCGKRRYSKKLPLICRSKAQFALLEAETDGERRQAAYDHRKATTVSDLAQYFNLCRKCRRWVCDTCYDVEDNEGACRDCSGRAKH